MKHNRINLIIVTFLLCSVAAAFAEPGKKAHRDAAIDLEQMQEKYARRFAAADSDGDGRVTEEEFANAARAAGDGKGKGKGKHKGKSRDKGKCGKYGKRDGSKAEWRERIFAEADRDGSGELSREELADYRKAKRRVCQRSHFSRLDRDGDGILTEEELSARLDHLKSQDKDGDGKLTGMARGAHRCDLPGHPASG